MEERPKWEQFEELVGKILSGVGYELDARVQGRRGDQGYDFDARFQGRRYAIEVKHYRSTVAKLSLIESAAARVDRLELREQEIKGILVVSCFVPSHQFASLGIGAVELIDRYQLLRLAIASAPRLADELMTLLEMRQDDLTREFGYWNFVVEPPVDPNGDKQRPPPEIDTQGTDLCLELREFKPGRENWKKFEDLCERILRYLFANELQGWHKQKRTEDGFSRYDFVCRIQHDGGFWAFLQDHLRSRYVVFEFKNYRAKIKQGQILTTEKYLLERGLRTVAIIISRKGADPGAQAIVQGAMREAGKLMLVLDDEQICEMLHLKEGGSDPADRLFELADDFLLRLPR